MRLSGEHWELVLSSDNTGVSIINGRFYGVALTRSPLFVMRVQFADGITRALTSSAEWAYTTIDLCDMCPVYTFVGGEELSGLVVEVVIRTSSDGVTFDVAVENDNADISVMELSYPTPHMTAPSYDLFLPIRTGELLEHAEQYRKTEVYGYPQHASMQFFAMYTEEGGIYIGIHDGEAAAKRFTIDVDEEMCHIAADMYAPGATMGANGFSLSGSCIWQAIAGDWYDAAMVYRAFTRAHATWLPAHGAQGRCDTSETFRNIPFWVCDYIPNSASQGANRPLNLSVGSDVYEPSYWYQAPLALRQRLGVPIAYHVYNWHEIPFNIEYPHFLPAKEEFLIHAPSLRAAGISVVPYINACAWEMHDSEGAHKETFETHGKQGVAVKLDGSFVVEHYPQTTRQGHQSDLAIMCGGYRPWHEHVAELARKMQNTLPIDGIYFDEIANVPAHPCYSHDHGHLPGGGTYWTEGYNEMMRSIREEKPKEHFHFTECNGEPYMKYMDGFLTWMWVGANEVPAFPAVYGDCVQLIGRCTIGNKKDDVGFFKYATARSLVSGQILGWCKADIVYSEAHMPYLERMVKCRCEHAAFLRGAVMLRPPCVTTSLGKYTTAAGLWFTDTIRSEWVLGGAFRAYDGGEVRLVLVNFSGEDTVAHVSFSLDEYHLDTEALPNDFVVHIDGTCAFDVCIPAEDVLVFTLPTLL